MSKRSGPNKENLEETRRIFLEKALDEFCEYGYPAASTSRIVTNSGMARGSLYYHFGDKYGLFEAIYVLMTTEAVHKLSAKMDVHKDPWEAFMAGSAEFIHICMDDKFRKIVLFEAQAAMSYNERLRILSTNIIGKLNEIVPELLKKGFLPGHTIQTAGVFILGYLGEIGRSFDFVDNIKAAREIHWNAYNETMSRLKTAS